MNKNETKWFTNEPGGLQMNQVVHDGPLFNSRVDAKDLGLCF